ncbi:MAG TPA: peptidylprolyl isomerase [Vicinamibacterales bacterium]|nr:peptidylprolyl isomerase [Vicinamibacterales bacterium]
MPFSVLMLLVMAVIPQARATGAQPRPGSFTTPYSLAEMTGKQAVVETSKGTFVFELLPNAAPNHVGFFMKQARDGAFNGTTFHRVIRLGIIQGGDPLSKDPAKSAQYGTGGMNLIKRELSKESHTIGTVSAVLAPGQPDSGGFQFFVCASPQVALDGQYSIFGRVVDGIEVVQAISTIDADDKGMAKERVVIKAVTIRDTPPPVKPPFVDATVAEMAKAHAVLDTTAGEIEVEFFPDKAPETVRNFLQLATAGVFDGMFFHRVVPNFVIQSGSPAFRLSPLTARQSAMIHNLAPEFTDTPNVPGTLSMARGDDPGSATSSFFICTGECRGLDNKYAVFGRVVRGMEVVTQIAMTPVDGETPKAPVLVKKITVNR